MKRKDIILSAFFIYERSVIVELWLKKIYFISMLNDKRLVLFGWAGSVHIQRWARGLTSRGYRVKVISLGDEPINGIETINLPRVKKWSYLKYSAQAAREALAFKPNVIHAHYAAGFGLWLLKTKFHPIVVSVWGSDIVDLPSNLVYKQLIKRTLKKADIITATSNTLKTTTLKLDKNLASKIRVVPFGVDIPEKIIDLPMKSPVKICFIKNHKMIYGPDILLKALARVVKEIPDIKLRMAGEGPDTDKIKELILKLKLERNVDMVGFIDNNRIGEFISQHHFMVMPSLKEAFGVAVLDSGANGRAVIGSDAGGIPEVLVDGKTGIIVPKNNITLLAKAILELAQDLELTAKMGEAGYNFVKENYNWDKSLDKMCDLYEWLIYEKK